MSRPVRTLPALALAFATLLPATTWAYQIDVTTSPVSGVAGDIITATVWLDDPTNVVSFDFGLDYDASVYAVSDVRPGADLAADWALSETVLDGPPVHIFQDFFAFNDLSVNSIFPGHLTIAGFGLDTLLTAGSLVEIDFEILPAAPIGASLLSVVPTFTLLQVGLVDPVDPFGPPVSETATAGSPASVEVLSSSAPVPEPAPLALFAAGLVALAFATRRRAPEGARARP